MSNDPEVVFTLVVGLAILFGVAIAVWGLKGRERK